MPATAFVILLGFSLATASDQDGRASVVRGLHFLETTQQADGGWMLHGESHPAVTSLVAKCFVQNGRYGVKHRVTEKALEFVLKHVRPDGGIYVADSGHANYETSVALMALAAANREQDRETIRNAQAYLVRNQWDESEGYSTSDVWYGGAGYGRHKRPDLSNTQMMLEALHQSGLSAEDPVFRKALAFISRSQMLNGGRGSSSAVASEHGGFIYTPVGGGESKAGTIQIEEADHSKGDDAVTHREQLRTYGSMTYAGFKSMLYAGVSKDDPRVKAAVAWIGRHYTLDSNPNMPLTQSKQGLYYYYHIFARALDAYGEEAVTDHEGKRHAWRKDLIETLVHAQRSDGSWSNSEDRWYEGNPYLVTAYSILALQTACNEDRARR